MGLTLAQAKVLGIAHLHPASGRDRSMERELLDAIEPEPSRRSYATSGLDLGMNKTEAAFWDRVRPSPLVRQIAREPLAFRLAGRTRYTPDFGVWPEPALGHDQRFTLIEVKGFMRDDASVKLKVAAEMYPCFRWLLARREKRQGWGWEVREVGRNGIGREPIHVAWIHDIP